MLNLLSQRKQVLKHISLEGTKEHGYLVELPALCRGQDPRCWFIQEEIHGGGPAEEKSKHLVTTAPEFLNF